MNLDKITKAVQVTPDVINWYIDNTQGQFLRGQENFELVQQKQFFQPLNMDEWNKKLAEDERKKAVENFKSERQAMLDNAIVTISTGKAFDADELSINRMVNAILAAINEPDTFIIKWSTADTGTGELVDCTLLELKEAHKLAMQNMASIWSIEG